MIKLFFKLAKIKRPKYRVKWRKIERKEAIQWQRITELC